jgi:VanZ family protein
MTGHLRQYPQIKLVALFCAGLGYVAVALLSWMPAAYRPDIGGVSDKLEHALAYLLLGALSAIAMRQTVNAHRLALAIIAYAGVLELGQLLIPDRVASVADFLTSAGGAIVGVSIVALVVRRVALR